VQLSNSELKPLCETLISAFPSWDELERLVFFHLGTHLETVVSAQKNLTQVVFTLVVWANTRGILEKLISGALIENPSNQDLRRYGYLTKSENQETKETISPAPAPNDTALLDLAHSVTVRFSDSILGDHRPVIREGIRNEITQLIKSTSLYGVLIGEAGSGKSVALATESLNLMELGWTVWPITLTDQEFSLDMLTDELNEKLPTGHRPLKWEEVVDIWGRGQVEGSAGLVIVIDHVDLAPNHVATQLEILDEVIEDHNLGGIKVLLSCRSDVWERGVKDLSFIRRTIEESKERRPKLLVIQVGDFTDSELDQFLQGIDANNLLARADSPGNVDYHVESVRMLLKRPETAREYSELMTHGEAHLSDNMTWSKLVELRLQHDLEPFEESNAILRQALTELAKLCWRQKLPEFRIDLKIVKENIPSLFVEIPDTGREALSLLENVGVLVECVSSPGNRIVCFRTVDTGSYLLSFTLANEARNKSCEDVRSLMSSWLDEAWNYAPLLDAVLAWIDRLSENLEDPLLLWIVETFIETGRNISAFRLVDPRVIGTIFALVETSDQDEFYAFREAALFLRPSREAIETIRRFLTSPNSLSRRLAAELVGVHQDKVSVPALVSLLEDEDEEVRSTTFEAFGRFGSMPLPFLLDALRDGSKSEVIRVRYLSALRNVGVRTEPVTEALAKNLNSALRGDANYFQSALLAGAHLRDREQIPFAIAGLRHNDPDVTWAAAKLLTEVPHSAAFDFLLDALTSERSKEGRLSQKHWLEKQLLAALAATDKTAVEPIIVDYLEEAFEGKAEIHFTEVVNIADRFRITPTYPILLEEMAVRMTDRRDGRFIFHASGKLAGAWEQQALDALRNKASTLLSEGSDIAELFVNEILPNMRENDEFPTGDCLNRVKDLHALIKSQATNLVPEACRLLNEASEISTAELSELFWLAGDNRAEACLVQKLDQPMAEKRGGWVARNAIVRALSMCGSEVGTNKVLSYLRKEPEISLYFSEEGILPLLRRRGIEPAQLIDIVRDPTASVGGRIASIEALADTDARAYRELFLAHSGDDEDHLVQLYAVHSLGRASDSGVISKLRRLLKESARAAIRSRAAQALSWLKARETIEEIECAFKNSNESGYVDALARFHEPSSLPLLLERMQSVRPESRRPYYAALGAFGFLRSGKQALRSELESALSRLPDYFDEQSALFKGIILHEPNFLLEACQGQGVWGRLSDGGRHEIARWIHHLWTNNSADKKRLFEVARGLVCDSELRVREMALVNVSLVGSELGQELHTSIVNDPKSDERVRACAIQLLGYFEGTDNQINKFRYGSELLVRRAADAALELKQHGIERQFHERQLGSSVGLARLSSYLCLKEHGDLGSLQRLKQIIPKQSIVSAYVGRLGRSISERLKRDTRKNQEREEELFQSRGTLWFD
jgi:HEAT repeat protein